MRGAFCLSAIRFRLTKETDNLVPNNRWTPARIAELRACVVTDGLPVAEIARLYNVGEGWIRKLLRRNGMPVRPDSNKNGRKALEEGTRSVRKTIVFSASQAAWLAEQEGSQSEVVRGLVEKARRK